MDRTHTTASQDAAKSTSVAHPPSLDHESTQTNIPDRQTGTHPSADPDLFASRLARLHNSPDERAGMFRHLQRSYGNSYAGSVVRGLQPRLTVRAPDDPLEREADKVAESVMRGHSSAVQNERSAALNRQATSPYPQITPKVQRQPAAQERQGIQERELHRQRQRIPEPEEEDVPKDPHKEPVHRSSERNTASRFTASTLQRQDEEAETEEVQERAVTGGFVQRQDEGGETEEVQERAVTAASSSDKMRRLRPRKFKSAQ